MKTYTLGIEGYNNFVSAIYKVKANSLKEAEAKYIKHIKKLIIKTEPDDSCEIIN